MAKRVWVLPLLVVGLLAVPSFAQDSITNTKSGLPGDAVSPYDVNEQLNTPSSSCALLLPNATYADKCGNPSPIISLFNVMCSPPTTAIIFPPFVIVSFLV